MDSLTIDQLKISAENLGFEPPWVLATLVKYDPEVLALATELARQGFSTGLVVEMQDKFGPAPLQLLLGLVNHKRRLRLGVTGDVIPGEVVEGVDADLLNVIIQQYLPLLIPRHLPAVMERYGTEINQFLLNLLMKGFQK